MCARPPRVLCSALVSLCPSAPQSSLETAPPAVNGLKWPQMTTIPLLFWTVAVRCSDSFAVRLCPGALSARRKVRTRGESEACVRKGRLCAGAVRSSGRGGRFCGAFVAGSGRQGAGGRGGGGAGRLRPAWGHGGPGARVGPLCPPAPQRRAHPRPSAGGDRAAAPGRPRCSPGTERVPRSAIHQLFCSVFSVISAGQTLKMFSLFGTLV